MASSNHFILLNHVEITASEMDIECQGLGPGKLRSPVTPVAGSWLAMSGQHHQSWKASCCCAGDSSQQLLKEGRPSLERTAGARYNSGQQISVLHISILQSIPQERDSSGSLLVFRLLLRIKRPTMIGDHRCLLPPAFCDCSDAAVSPGRQSDWKLRQKQCGHH